MEWLTIFFSLLFHYSCTQVSWGKKEIKYEAGISVPCKGFEKMECPSIFFLSSFHDSCIWVSLGKKEIKYEAGFYVV
jgi:hypothetical protein